MDQEQRLTLLEQRFDLYVGTVGDLQRRLNDLDRDITRLVKTLMKATVLICVGVSLSLIASAIGLRR